MRAIVTGLSVLLLAGAAAAQTVRKVPQQYPTIQAACDAEETVDGDTILVSKKADGTPYDEWVLTYKRLNFTGKKVLWDGHKSGGGSSTCLTISAESAGGLTVQGFQFRNGSAHLSIGASGVVVQKCTFRNAYGTSVSIGGDGAVVRGCTFRNNQRAVSIEASEGVVIEKVTATGHGSGGIYVWSPGTRVAKCRVSRSGEGSAIYVSGYQSTVSGNTILDGYTGIYLFGDDGLVEKNKIARFEGDDSGIDAYGRGLRILGNTVTTIDGLGIYVDGSLSELSTENLVEGNKVRWTVSRGIAAYSARATIRRNTVQHTGYRGIDASYWVPDSEILVAENRVQDVFGDGISAGGGGTSVVGNDVRSVSGYGIYSNGSGYTGENLVRGNRVRGFFNGGIYVNAYLASYRVEGNAVSDGMSWAGGIEVYAPDATAGVVHANRVTGTGGDGIYVYADTEATGFEVTGNVVDGSGTNWNRGIYALVYGSTVSGNAVQDTADAGIVVGGNGNLVEDNRARNCLRVCLGISEGTGNEVTGNVGVGSDGEGFANYGSATIFTGNTFLGNRLDVANSGSFATADIAAVNVFQTGGAGQPIQVWD